MSNSVQMPALGESVTEGTVTRWLKQVGDTVEADEPLLEVSTDKVDTEVPSPFSGTLQKILVEEDETVEVGAALAEIGDGPAEAGAPPAQEEPKQEAPAEEPKQEAPKPSGGGGGGEPVKMPALGESVTEGTVTRWLKEVGDSVDVDEPLLEVSTDKVDTEVPSPIAGTLQKILVQEDETAEVGADLCLVGEGAGGQEAPAAEAPKDEPKAQAPAAEAPKAADADSGEDAGYVTPLVRKLAKEHGVDLTSLTGTGVGGRIRKQDVLDAAGGAGSAPAAQPAQAAAEKPAAAATSAPAKPATVLPESDLRGQTVKMSRMRKVIAERMVASLQTAAQLTTVVKVDVTGVATVRARSKAAFEKREGAKLSFMPFFVLAACEALKAFPVINSQVDGDSIIYHGATHLGIAVDTEKGLMVPVVKDAGDLNIAGLTHRISEMAEKTRTGKIGPDELSGGTFTITNTGSRGALFDTPIVNQPQSAILGLGAVVKEPGVVTVGGSDMIGIRSYCYLALSYDHRIIDGADAARFLSAMKARLEEGAFEV